MKPQRRESAIGRLEGIKVASKPKTSMPISERAKQFLPFAAVKGLPEALAKKEKVAVMKIELSEEMAMALNEKLHLVNHGTKVTVTYFDTDVYLHLTGTVMQVDTIFRTLQIDDTEIEMDDIIDLEIQ